MLSSRRNSPTVENQLPANLRQQLENVRLDLLALFRTLDSLLIAADLPQELQALFELDADFAEALAVLDHPPGGYDLAAMQRDTLASLNDLAAIETEFFDTLDAADRKRLSSRRPIVRAALDPSEAYSQIPGRDPRVR